MTYVKDPENFRGMVKPTAKVLGILVLMYFSFIVGGAFQLVDQEVEAYDEFADVREYDAYLERYYEEFPEKDPCNTPGVEMMPFDVC